MTSLSESEKTLWVRGLITFGFAAALGVLTWMANSISNLSESMVGLQRDQGYTTTQLNLIREKLAGNFTQSDAAREFKRLEQTTNNLYNQLQTNEGRLDDYGQRIRDLERGE